MTRSSAPAMIRYTDASSSLRDLNVAGCNLAFVGSKGCQDFGLLTLRNFEEIQGPSELRCDLIKFCWRDPEIPVGLLKAERRRAGLGGLNWNGPPKRRRPTASA